MCKYTSLNTSCLS